MDLLEIESMCNENKYKNTNVIKCFDWEKAISIILEKHIMNASAYIDNDQEFTEDMILCDGEPVGDHEAILESYNGTPILFDMDHQCEYPCYYDRPVTNWTGQSMLLWRNGVMNKEE